MSSEETSGHLSDLTQAQPSYPPATAGAQPAEPHKCTCQQSRVPEEQFVYAMGRIEVRFPSLGIEREFQQRETKLGQAKEHLSRGQRIARVLEANHHLATRLCYVLSMSGIPSYIVAPTGVAVRGDLVRAVASPTNSNQWCVLIGKRGPMSTPTTCGGVLAPIVACDQIYCFTGDEWLKSLESSVTPALKARKIEAAAFRQTAAELFERFAGSTENLGATDAHRALNYLVVQHPGLFLAAAERSRSHTLDRIETREIQGMGVRRLIAAIFSFLDITTCVPERLYCRVDVTEEWPFIADSMDGSKSPLGLLPFIENGMWGMAY